MVAPPNHPGKLSFMIVVIAALHTGFPPASNPHRQQICRIQHKLMETGNLYRIPRVPMVPPLHKGFRRAGKFGAKD
jgi:hypothetical protein